MKPRFLVLAAMLLVLWPPAAAAQASSAGTGMMLARSGCFGPYCDFPAALSSPTSVSACQNFSANTNYELTQNIGSDATAVCGTFTQGSKIDLKGFVITGILKGVGINNNNVRVFSSVLGGQINCDANPATEFGCIHQSATAVALTGDPPEISHLTISNAHNSGADTQYTVYFFPQFSTAGVTAGKIHHVEVISNAAPSSNRVVGLNVNSGSNAIEIYNNRLKCVADSKTCNCIQGSSKDGLYHDNLCEMVTNTTATAGRGIILQPEADSTSTGTKTGNKVYENFFAVNNNRAIRFRQCKECSSFGNVIAKCSAPMQQGCYHMGDPDTGNHIEHAGHQIHDEIIEMTGGKAFWSIDISDYKVYNIRLIGTSGRVGDVQAPSKKPAISSVSRTSNVVTLVTAAASDVQVGDTVTVAGVTDTTFNGVFVVTQRDSSTQFQYAQAAGNASSSGGTVTIHSAGIVFCGISGAASLDTGSTNAANTTVTLLNAGSWSGAGTRNTATTCP